MVGVGFDLVAVIDRYGSGAEIGVFGEVLA